MSLRQASEADLPGVLTVENAGFVADRWSEALWRDELTGGDRAVLVHADAHEEIDAVATFQAVADTVDLHRVVVHPVARRRGLATLLIVEGIAWGIERGAGRMLLEVDAANAPALACYERLGFATIAERRDYYAPGVHALVMERTLEGVR